MKRIRKTAEKSVVAFVVPGNPPLVENVEDISRFSTMSFAEIKLEPARVEGNHFARSVEVTRTTGGEPTLLFEYPDGHVLSVDLLRLFQEVDDAYFKQFVNVIDLTPITTQRTQSKKQNKANKPKSLRAKRPIVKRPVKRITIKRK
jgi:hypothetical protein